MKILNRFVISVAILLLLVQSSSVLASSLGTPACDVQYAVAKVPAPDSSAIFSLVQASPGFNAIQSNDLAYVGMAYESHFDESTCSVTPKFVDVEYMSTNTNGTQRIHAFEVDTNATRIIGEWSQLAFYATVTCSSSASSCTPSATWSGYESSYSSGGSKVEQLEATMVWALPTVDFPSNHNSTDQPSCSTPSCGLAIWSGLTDFNTLLQAGSFGTINLRCDCSSYQLWYEEVPSPAVFCTAGDPAPGDSVESHLYSATLVGGSSGYWYLFVEDNTNGNICQPTNPFSKSFDPTYAEFITERPCETCFGFIQQEYSLPYFTILRPEGRMYYSGSVHGLDCSGCGQYINQYAMENPASSSGVQNIKNLAITDTGTNWGYFTDTWRTSQNT